MLSTQKLISPNFDRELFERYKKELSLIYDSKFDLIYDHKSRINNSKKEAIIKLLEEKSDEKYKGLYI